MDGYRHVRPAAARLAPTGISADNAIPLPGSPSRGVRVGHSEALWTPSFSPWLIAVVVAMAAFMEILDMTIANVALPYMAGTFAATTTESTWILTSYLVSNAIVLRTSAWFANILGRKRFFMICLVIFTLSSVLCGFAPSLPAMLFFRVLQGADGGRAAKAAGVRVRGRQSMGILLQGVPCPTQ